MITPLEPLNQHRIYQECAPVIKKYWGTIKLFETIGSTNTYLLTQKSSENVRVCCAEQQTAGRGRQGNVWFSPPGCNLYLSLLWPFKGSLQALSGLSLSVGVGVATALKRYGVNDAQVKWPNDIWVGDAKLAGILIEVAGKTKEHCDVVIGLGINGQMSPLPEVPIDKSWTDLSRVTQKTVQRNRLVAYLLTALHAELMRFQVEGLLSTVAEWPAWDALKGRTIELIRSDEHVQGCVQGIDSSGRLVIATGEGIRAFTEGEIRLHNAQNYGGQGQSSA